jgi:hypothetical protein
MDEEMKRERVMQEFELGLGVGDKSVGKYRDDCIPEVSVYLSLQRWTVCCVRESREPKS